VSRRPIAALAVVAVLAVGVAAGIVLIRDDEQGDADREASRRAAERACEPAAETADPGLVLTGSLALRPVAEVDSPTAAVFVPDGSGDGLLAERDGRVLRIDGGVVTDDVVLDLGADTMQEGDGGLLGLAYAPGGDWLYTYRADADRDDVLAAFPLDHDGLPEREGARDLLTVDHPDSLQHHGGGLVVGSDGLLYVGLGDGGGLGDPRENAQDTDTLLGKVLRIDPTPDAADPYRIPPDNPFADGQDGRPEIWLVGVRNPFRMGLDQATGDLWLGDVGQTCWEEIDHLPTGAESAGGANLGWDHVEGSHRFEGGTVPGRRLDPVQEHPHEDGWCSIIAGYVPRDAAVPQLEGRLLYTDYCKGRVLALAVDLVDPGVDRLVDTGLRVENPIAIVPGPSGRPWVLSLGGTVVEIVGT
jgi:glucose/arabinose dehydrogenase